MSGSTPISTTQAVTSNSEQVPTENTTWGSTTLLPSQHHQQTSHHHVVVMPIEPPPTTTTPTPRDRAYTYVMHLSVTRVRDICRASGLKQFGKKSESQPRLFWGAESLVTGDESMAAWCEALPGLREWVNAPHREQSTLWRIAPPRNARPLDFHTYFAHTLTARRSSGAAAGSSGNLPPVKEEEEMEDDDTIAIAVGDTPTERDRLYTYARSLSITVVRRLCKRMGLKQFGRKRESQKRLWWYLTSPEYTPIADDEGEIDPRSDGIQWAATVTPDRWFRAPEEELRPTPSVVRLRDRAVQRRKKFSANELARLVAVLVSSPEMRARFCSVLQSRRTGGANEAAFWAASVAPVFNDPGFIPRIHNSPSRDQQATPNNITIEPRGGDELRRHFDRACPAFIRAYRRWSADEAQPVKFASYLRERRRSDTGAPLSPTEKRANIFFVVLKCGDEEQYTEVLRAVLDNTSDGLEMKIEEEIHRQPQLSHLQQHPQLQPLQQQEERVQQHHPQAHQPQVHQPPEQQQSEHSNEQIRLVVAPPDPLPVAATVAPETAQVTQVEPVIHAVSVSQAEPVVHTTVALPTVAVVATVSPPTPTTQTEMHATTTTGQYTSDLPVTNIAAGSTAHPEEGNGSSVLGKRPRVCIESLKEEVDILKKKVEDVLAPVAKMQRSVVRAQQEKELNQAMMTARQLKKELDADPSDGIERLRAANAATIERLTKDIEDLSKQQ